MKAPHILRPRPLRPGGTIGIMAPSSRVDRESVEKACNWLDNYGFGLRVHPQTFATHDQSAGTAAEKCAALHDLLRDPGVDAVMMARGGNRAGLMLAGLDYALLTAHPKPLIGYSDGTALLNGITTRTGLVTFHGPSLSSFVNGTEEKHLELAFLVMAGMVTDLPVWGSVVTRPGLAEGRLVGGNLSVLSSLMGTPWQPDFTDAIVFIEDTGDQQSRYDRMLIQLANAGLFKQAAAVIFGDLSAVEDHGAVPFTLALDEILHDIAGDSTCPIVRKAPFGHRENNVTLPIGMTVRLNARADREVALKLTGPAVSK